MKTLAETVDAIIARSGAVHVPEGGTLILEADDDGRYRLVEKLTDGVALGGKGIKPRGPDGRRLPAGALLTQPEMAMCVRVLLGIDREYSGRPKGGGRAAGVVRHIVAANMTGGRD